MAEWTEGCAGQAPHPYPFYVDIVTKRYFDAVDKKDLQRVLDCFHEDAVLTEVTSDTVHTGRDAGIRSMFVRLFADLDPIWHGNFVHTVDPQTNAVCSQFTVLVTTVHALDWLRLGPEHHERAKFRWEDNSWEAHWACP